MIVISDTSAITSLLQINRAELLKQVFSRVIIPLAVKDELTHFHETLPAFIEIANVQAHGAVDQLCISIDRGEAEAIILAQELFPDFLLIDDLAARAIAIEKGLPVIGLAGVLLKAKTMGLVISLNEIIIQLELVAGFRMSPKLKSLILQSGGE